MSLLGSTAFFVIAQQLIEIAPVLLGRVRRRRRLEMNSRESARSCAVQRYRPAYRLDSSLATLNSWSAPCGKGVITQRLMHAADRRREWTFVLARDFRPCPDDDQMFDVKQPPIPYFARLLK